jgi:hypothetical protein
MIDMLGKYKETINNAFAIHPFHLLFEHKKTLSLIIKNFSSTNPSLIKDIDALVIEALIIRNLVLFCNQCITEHGIYNRYDNIIEKLLNLKNNELNIMRSLLQEYE